MRNESPADARDVDVSIIVPCRNERGHVRAFLDGLLAQQTEGLPWEVLIADGMSDDGTREILDEYAAGDSRIRVIENPARIVSTALNEAIRQARGAYVVRMDVHTRYASDYIRRCVEILLESGADNVGGPARTRSVGRVACAIAQAYHSAFGCGGARFHDVSYEGYVDTVVYGCWRRSKLIELGLFDEALVRNQDDELNLRLIRSGGKIYQSPRIVSWYSPRSSLSALFRQYLQYGFWKVAVIRKHGSPASWRHLIPGLFVVANLGLAGLTLVGFTFGARDLLLWSGAVWAAVVGAYLGASVIASLPSWKPCGWLGVLLQPAVFACYHVSYGLGFLMGLLYWPRRGARSPVPTPLLTRLTR